MQLEYAKGAVSRHEPEPASFDVPEQFVIGMPAIESALATLTSDEIETFVDGEFDEAAAISARSAALLLASVLLDAMFDGD